MKRIGLALMLAALAGLAGCADDGGLDMAANPMLAGNNPAQTELVAQRRPPVPDLPVPIGFNLDQRNSRSFATSGNRWIIHVFKGRVDKWAVGRFYRREMPVNGWSLEAERVVKGTVFLEFRKDRERCVIQVTDSRLSGTEIRMEVYSVGTMQGSR